MDHYCSNTRVNLDDAAVEHLDRRLANVDRRARDLAPLDLAHATSNAQTVAQNARSAPKANKRAGMIAPLEFEFPIGWSQFGPYVLLIVSTALPFSTL
jgi:hypothetical protein